MTRAERDRLHEAFDEARRRQIAAERRGDGRQRCSGCQIGLHEYTRGCRQCSERRSSRARRASAIETR